MIGFLNAFVKWGSECRELQAGFVNNKYYENWHLWFFFCHFEHLYALGVFSVVNVLEPIFPVPLFKLIFIIWIWIYNFGIIIHLDFYTLNDFKAVRGFNHLHALKCNIFTRKPVNLITFKKVGQFIRITIGIKW